MGHEVYAGTWEIAAKSGMNKSIARFPDVCMSPPSPPAGPIPVPYPDTSFSSDLKEGSQTVKLGGEPAALAQQSYYKPSVLGDEAATRTFGANVVTHVITGKTYFQAWSLDVKIEGKNVCRHLDITTSNHASGATTTAPVITTEAQTLLSIMAGKCPCCRGPLHENQKDDAGKPLLPPMTQAEYYQSKKDAVDAKIAGFPKWVEDQAKAGKPGLDKAIITLKFGAPDIFPHLEGPRDELAAVEKKRAQQALNELKELETKHSDCPNLHKPPDVGCGTHFDVPNTKRTKQVKQDDGTMKSKQKTPTDWARDEVTKGVKNAIRAEARLTFPGRHIPDDDQVNHMTPLDAGGCPISPHNMIPDGALSEECLRIDRLQGALQGRS
ncbi:MAG: DUF4150 domain-containing protein [Gammaproteobacteria bacterium]